ncbi:MAG: hypothetical protein U0L20_00545 [Ruminococcus sp.]|nr:hypothetical protein [Ruminococcus sp.]
MQYKRHESAKKCFKKISENPQNYLIIHYSCESFYDINDGHTPRITSIAVYHYASGQTDSFSIHKTAEKLHIDLKEIEKHFDQLELSMLSEFFKYVEKQQHLFWIHWNMRDINYGFKAIEHRFSVLGGTPVEIPDNQKIDLPRKLIDCYGVKYIDHPRMQKLIEKNNITAKDFLSGQQESEAFKNHEYVKLHMSTLRKVDVFADLVNRAINNNLKVNSKWTEIYGVSIPGIMNFCKDTWWIQVIWTITSMILGGLIGELISHLF